VCIIPARYSSSRLPGKPLLDETGKYLIQHVYEAASRSAVISDVVVATDDGRIKRAVEGFGGRAVLIVEECSSGTDRVARALRTLDADYVVNVQGDEPEIEPEVIDALASELAEGRGEVVTAAAPLEEEADYGDPACVKVVVDANSRALYFSRSPIPFFRDRAALSVPGTAFKHVGVYGYARDVLERFVQWPRGGLERAEQLEQLRLLEQGVPIKVVKIAHAYAGVDTPADYARFVARYRSGNGD